MKKIINHNIKYLIIESTDNIIDIMKSTKCERYNYVFYPTNFKEIPELQVLLINNQNEFGKLCSYETMCDSSKWK